jgi:gluconate 2-dehydrogenase gamma chain
MVAYHDSFDREDLDFILSGAKELKNRGYKSIMIEREKEQMLREFSQSRFGENWISLLLNYTLEAMLSDPLYGGNKDEIGWKAYRHHAGVPRPTKRFGAKNG